MKILYLLGGELRESVTQEEIDSYRHKMRKRSIDFESYHFDTDGPDGKGIIEHWLIGFSSSLYCPPDGYYDGERNMRKYKSIY